MLPFAEECGRTEDAAYEAVKAARIEKGKDPAAEADIDDHLSALGARVAPLAADFQALMAASLKACGALYPDHADVSSPEELEGLLKGTKHLQLWRSSSARAGADDALTLIMSWHEEIELAQIQTLQKDGAWNTDPKLIAIRQAAANYMAKYANTSMLDREAEVYSDAKEGASESEAAESEDSGNYQDSGDEDDDDDDSDGGERRIPAGVRFTGSGKEFFADTSSSDASSDSGLAEFDEQETTSDVAKTDAAADPAKAGKASLVNVQAGEASNPVGSESAPQTESQSAAPEADVIVTPPSPTPAATSTSEAQAEEIQTETNAAPTSNTADAASV